VLSVWTKVESVLASLPGGNATRMQIIRLRTDDGKRIVGKLKIELKMFENCCCGSFSQCYKI